MRPLKLNKYKLMKSIIYLLILFFAFQLSYSQSLERQVISTSGETLSNSSNRLDFTVGELVVNTITNGYVLTQGFQQGELILSIKLNPKLFLQGPINAPASASLMNDDLRAGGLIPTTSPYPDGLSVNTLVFTPTGSDAIVDWVFVALRDGLDNSIIVESKSALLQRDGDVVSIDGISELSFSQSSGNYYVAINHRNHLGILSAATVALSSVTTLVDLSADPIAVLGGTNALIDMGSGIFAMYGGDANGDGQILNTDISEALLLTGTAGYSGSDSDLNGQILNTDITLIIQPNAGKAQQY